MRLSAPRLVSVPDGQKQGLPAIERNFTSLRRFFDRLLAAVQFLDGTLITADLGAGSTDVEHLLGRSYRGWWITSGSVNADYPGEGTSPDSSKWLRLTVTNAQTVNLWVF